MHSIMIEKGIGLAFAFLFVWHEYSWVVKRYGWLRTNGIVVKFIEREDSEGIVLIPVVEWEYNGITKTFKSRYDKGFSEVGQVIEIVHSPNGEDAERYSFGNRYFVSIVGFLGALISILLWI